MRSTSEDSVADEQTLLTTARAGDSDAFAQLVAPHAAKLQAHAYRMLGSSHDAEDAVQDALLRAWRALSGFDGRSAFGSWLYRIVTNVCLNQLKQRSRRVLPVDYGYSTSDPHAAAEEPLIESVWVEPYAGQSWIEGVSPTPESQYVDRESVELAFIAALQYLRANSRAALLLTDVLGFSAREAAETLETTTAALNSALQRARKLIAERVPEQSQQATLRVLGDAKLNEVVEQYLQAMERADVDGVVALLTEDAVWSMPPQAAWFRGRRAISDFLVENPFRYFRWRLRPMWVNGQPTAAAYSWDERAGRYLPHTLNVLTFAGDRISEVTSFLDVTRRGVQGPGFTSFADDGLFERFGLPSDLPA